MSGILKRCDRVYVFPVADATSQALLTDLKTCVQADSVVDTGSSASYNILNVSGFKHRRVNQSKSFVNKRGNHIDGIEYFWIQSRRVLREYNGVPCKYFSMFLKECEFRFDYGTPRQQLAPLRPWVNI